MPVLNRLFVCVLPAVLAGCASGPSKVGDPPFWPKPPDTPRFIYEASLRSESNVIKQTQAEKIRQAVVGADDKNLMAYEKPYDIASRYGKVVISDTMTNTLVMFDLAKNRMRRIGHLKHGKLLDPLGIDMDYLMNIYVADEQAFAVKVYDDVGFFLGSIGSSESLARPVDVAVNPAGDRIYVVDNGGIDSHNHRIVIFDKEGVVLNTIGTRGSKEGQFNLPTQATVAPDGTLYVLDAGNFRVQVFDMDGNFLRTWGKVGRTLGDFARPRGIASDDNGNIYVTDAAYRNFQIFNPEGKLLMFVGDEGLQDLPGQYAMPAGIAVDENNRIYVVDQMHRKVEVLRSVGEGEAKRLALKYRRMHPEAQINTLPAKPESYTNTALEETYGGKPGQTIEEVIEAEKKQNEAQSQSAETVPEKTPVKQDALEP